MSPALLYPPPRRHRARRTRRAPRRGIVVAVVLALLAAAVAAIDPLHAQTAPPGAPPSAPPSAAPPSSWPAPPPLPDRLPHPRARASGAAPSAAAGCTSTAASLPDVYARVSPAVVSIAALSINAATPEDRVERVSGSGVVIDDEGLVLTNAHVAAGRQVLHVTLDDGTTLPARLLGADRVFDLALVQVPTGPGVHLVAARLGDSDALRIGDDVYAIGSPLGLDQTLTRGIVSATNRLLPGGLSLTEPLIQTDAAINPGNSGGPLVDRCGSVVGLTTAILPDAQSIGFAIPMRLIRAVIPELLDKGRVVRPWLGVQGQFVDPAVRELLRAPLADGFLVEAVEPGSPAEKLGVRGGTFELTVDGNPVLLGGDVITAVNDVVLKTPDDFDRALERAGVDSVVRLDVRRGAESRRVSVLLVERPPLPGDAGPLGRATGAANVTGAAVPAGGVRPRRRAL